MTQKRLVLWNSLVWAGALLACAVVLKDTGGFIGVLLVLICGAVASDALLAASSDRSASAPPDSSLR
jgi:hypothetical protein